MEKNTHRTDIRKMTYTAVVTALLCVLAPFSIPVPISPVPISLANFVIFLSVIVLEWKQAFVSVGLYLLIGLVGLPVFSGFSGGFAKLAGPTGGYLIGYIPLVIIAGLMLNYYKGKRWKPVYIVGIITGEAVLYAIGTLWLSQSLNVNITEALAMAVIPYLPGDILKMIAAMIIGGQIKVLLK